MGKLLIYNFTNATEQQIVKRVNDFKEDIFDTFGVNVFDEIEIVQTSKEFQWECQIPNVAWVIDFDNTQMAFSAGKENISLFSFDRDNEYEDEQVSLIEIV